MERRLQCDSRTEDFDPGFGLHNAQEEIRAYCGCRELTATWKLWHYIVLLYDEKKSSKITSGYKLRPDNFYLEAMLASLLWWATDCWDILPRDIARLITASAQGQLDFSEN